MAGNDSPAGNHDQTAICSILGSSRNVLFEELAEEAELYLNLLEKLKRSPAEAQREDLETELYASVNHLWIHAKLLVETIDEAMDGL